MKEHRSARDFGREVPVQTRGAKLPRDATPEVHRYGTYNIQPTTDTDNLLPLIAPGLPREWKDLKLGKEDLEE